MTIKELEKEVNTLKIQVELLTRILQGGNLPLKVETDVPCKYTLFSWLEKWLNEIHVHNVSLETFKKDSGIFKNHVFTKSEYDKPLNEFKPIDLTALVNSIQSSRQRQICSNHVISSLRCAFDNDLLKKDITKNYKKPTHEYEEDRAATRIEEKRLLTALEKDKYKTLFKVYLFSGLRRNEALGLQRKHLDFINNEIHVLQQTDKQGNIISKLKTKTSYRIVKMFPELKAELLQFEKLPQDEILFKVNSNTITKHFERLCQRLKIENFSIKSLRATFATRYKEKGIPEDIIQAWLGHGSYKTTKKHYLKINADYVNAEFEKVVKADKIEPLKIAKKH